jgi:hypothetical protein
LIVEAWASARLTRLIGQQVRHGHWGWAEIVDSAPEWEYAEWTRRVPTGSPVAKKLRLRAWLKDLGSQRLAPRAVNVSNVPPKNRETTFSTRRAAAGIL